MARMLNCPITQAKCDDWECFRKQSCEIKREREEKDWRWIFRGGGCE